MANSPENEPKRTPSREQGNPFSDLASIPSDAFRRALQHGMDSAEPMFLSEDDSRIAIAQAIRQAMAERELTVYQLHEATGLSVDILNTFIEAEAIISDSFPITMIGQALGIDLGNL